ncbi:hypothetical protein [Dyella sp.]|uniref:hypothetical protein n=1 Tax=Dyella sp. TaxID=1869338 RepID=UPI002842ECA1|nr:hypothetical protein [Dyella sp.]MDR3445966.1 hypothetical protein [Dyella sp.]
MKNIIGRLNDWRLERHIRFLKVEFRRAYDSGDKSRARVFCAAMAEAMSSRSPEQVERMERARGLR